MLSIYQDTKILEIFQIRPGFVPRWM